MLRGEAQVTGRCRVHPAQLGDLGGGDGQVGEPAKIRPATSCPNVILIRYRRSTTDKLPDLPSPFDTAPATQYVDDCLDVDVSELTSTGRPSKNVYDFGVRTSHLLSETEKAANPPSRVRRHSSRIQTSG